MFDFAIRMRLWVGIFIGILLFGYSFSYLLESPGAAIAGMFVGGGIVATFGYLILRYEGESKPGPIAGTRKASPTQDSEERSRSRLPKLSEILDFLNGLDARFGFGLSPRGPWPLKWDRRRGPNRLERWLAHHALLAAVGSFILGVAAFYALILTAGRRFTWGALSGPALVSVAIYVFGRQLTGQVEAWKRQEQQRGHPEPP